MSRRTRRIGALLGLVLLLGAGAYYWWVLRPGPLPSEQALPREEVELYFLNRNTYRLQVVRRRVTRAADTASRIVQITDELTTPPRDPNLVALVPEEVSVRSAFVDGQTVFLNFNDEIVGAAEGSSGERMLLYSIVNSVLANLPPSHKLVHFLVEGEMRKTIGPYGEESGHIAVQYPLGPRWDLADTSS